MSQLRPPGSGADALLRLPLGRLRDERTAVGSSPRATMIESPLRRSLAPRSNGSGRHTRLPDGRSSPRSLRGRWHGQPLRASHHPYRRDSQEVHRHTWHRPVDDVLRCLTGTLTARTAARAAISSTSVSTRSTTFRCHRNGGLVAGDTSCERVVHRASPRHRAALAQRPAGKIPLDQGKEEPPRCRSYAGVQWLRRASIP